MSETPAWTDFLRLNREQAVSDLLDLLRIPSISTDPAYAPEVNRAAEWVADRLRRAGIENVAVHPTGEHSCVTGDWLHAPGKPTILVYGHFDVQPADPLELWESPPFEPIFREDRIVARGTSDMKANLLLPILAAEAILRTEGALPVNVKFLLEGQEESLSRDLGPFVSAHRDLLACDCVISADGVQWSVDQGAVWMGVKGACALQVELETSTMDLHSGLYGGGVPNALHAMAQLIASLHSPEGAVAVEGFYDQVVPLSDEELRRFAAIPFDENAYRAESGVSDLVGEPGYSTLERTGGRPTLEVNGLWGGYQGEGLKTVIPAKAFAKISCRLVPDQDPAQILDVVSAHLTKHTPKGAKLKITRLPIAARPYRVQADEPFSQIVGAVLAEEYGREPYYVRIGGSLPITDMFLQELGAYTVALGFSLPDERFHSPNEFFRLDNLHRGTEVYGKLLNQLGR